LQNVKVAVVGFGNVGQKVVEAVLQSPDMDIVGLVELEHLLKMTKLTSFVLIM
jgi:diaminopimelate dehydrogenase